MSRIYLNYDDVNDLASALERSRPEKDLLPSFKIIATAFDLESGELLERLIQVGPHEQCGVPLSWQQYCDLCLAMETRDLTQCNHTERLEVVAASLGWRADILMPFLKNTTGEAGRNQSLRRSEMGSRIRQGIQRLRIPLDAGYDI